MNNIKRKLMILVCTQCTDLKHTCSGENDTRLSAPGLEKE